MGCSTCASAAFGAVLVPALRSTGTWNASSQDQTYIWQVTEKHRPPAACRGRAKEVLTGGAAWAVAGGVLGMICSSPGVQAVLS